jgi:hypothetical protein
MRFSRSCFVCLTLLLPTLGCIEDRLSVDITTYVHADGSCTRRIEYRLVRVDTNKNDARQPIDASQDVLRLFHRFPSGDRWNLNDDASSDLHVVTAEASLPSLDELDWDFWRQRSPRLPPARNHVSFAISDDEARSYDYRETFVDPASPLSLARHLAELLLRRQDDFVGELSRRLGPRSPRASELKRAYRERLALPFQKRVAGLFDAPSFGPRERKRLEQALEQLDRLKADLTEDIVAASPIAAPDELRAALEPAFDAIGEAIERDLEAAGLSGLPFESERGDSLRFRATLVMPAPILRANTCVQGNTATWEFDQSDLYGRGFEMWVRAGALP